MRFLAYTQLGLREWRGKGSASYKGEPKVGKERKGDKLPLFGNQEGSSGCFV